MTDITTQIDTHLTSNLTRYIQETVRLCAQPSISATGQGVVDCSQIVAALLEEHGLQVQTFTGYGNPIVLGKCPGKSAKTLLFYNHYDVQPVEPLELWTSPPFEPVERDGKLYARGVADDKGEFIARLAALDAVCGKEHRKAAHGGGRLNTTELPCSVLFVLEGEEEVGSPHIARFVKDHVKELTCHGAVWEGGGIDPEGHPQLGTTEDDPGIPRHPVCGACGGADEPWTVGYNCAHSGGARRCTHRPYPTPPGGCTGRWEHSKDRMSGSSFPGSTITLSRLQLKTWSFSRHCPTGRPGCANSWGSKHLSMKCTDVISKRRFSTPPATSMA